MKMFEVEWQVNTGGGLASPYLANRRNKRIFTERTKADAFYAKLFDAANVLLIQGSIEATVQEVEID